MASTNRTRLVLRQQNANLFQQKKNHNNHFMQTATSLLCKRMTSEGQVGILPMGFALMHGGLLCSMGFLYDQFSNCDRDDWAASERKDLHVQETHPLSQLDWSPNQR